MKNKIKLIAVLSAMAMALAVFGCKTDTETEWKDKTYCAAVTFASEPTEDGVEVTMATATEGAKIYYTTDGTVPTAESTEYTEPVEFKADTTLKAIAIKAGIENSPVSVATVSIKEKTVEVDKKADETAPACVTNLAAQAKDSRVLLTWTDAADEDVYGYEVTYSGTNPINRVVLPALDSKTMMAGKGAGGTYVSGLENGTEYTFTVKTVDTSGNKSEGATVNATPVAGETMKIALEASVPQENGYTGTKSNTKTTVTATITTAGNVKKVVWKKDGSVNAKTLLADEEAEEATVTEDNAVWTFDISATDESANGTYTVAAIDEAGREEAEQIAIDSFDFTAPGKVKVTSAVYSSELSSITISWTEPADSDYDHVDITFTSNDGTGDSEPSEAVTVKKGTANYTFNDINGEKKYYAYTFVTYDELGNKSAEYTRKVFVKGFGNVLEGFVGVAGGTVTGSTPHSEASDANYNGVFITGRTVTLSDFYMSQYEVTKAQYKEIMEDSSLNTLGITADPSYSSLYPKTYVKVSTENDDNRPVEGVSWYDAVYFCNLLSKKEGLDPVYTIESAQTETKEIPDEGNSGEETKQITYIKNATVTADHTKNGYRLPTEAEWEYAARGGNPDAPDWNYTFSGADNTGDNDYTSSSDAGLDAVGWYSYNTCNGGTTGDAKVIGTAGYGVHQVGLKSPNALGIYDMSGNAWEWCFDKYGTVSEGNVTNPTDPTDSNDSEASRRVVRGGSWVNSAGGNASCFRNSFTPDCVARSMGFRVVRNAN